ncbi:16S rRNA (guanine(966)-N(2))-methyltransferase [Sodalis endosymbiont of Henestaris halophilus]|uniref:16S rRNA (guanine(966)-N(2))-methyltransferase n=1 Tax=Sodalis endosymbiont of Henestaris halophilus TaxID=1929246 RepID=UPI000BE265AA|nr:16S rRNA (guanine(966)-N(2))-methyltransferase [Sodalis endosymbiont of Henestaris halophilus]
MVNHNSNRTSGKIRITGGRWCGRKLPVLNSPGLRPTLGRVRETLFNWLAPVIQEAHCLDCFAGSGALGLEALSRGAASVTLLEKNRTVSKQLAKNLQVLQAHKAKIITANSLLWLEQQSDVFNVVFIDPPFRNGLITKTVIALEQNRCLAYDAWIYIETSAENLAFKVPAHWQLHRKKVARQVTYRLYICHETPQKHYNTDYTD